MKLSKFDLVQVDSERIEAMTPGEKDSLILKLVSDLREALDRLNQNSSNSSCPPSSEAPWQSSKEEEASGQEENSEFENCESKDAESETGKVDEKGTDSQEGSPESKSEETKRKPGRQEGAEGHSRKVNLPVTKEVVHRPEECTICDNNLDPEKFVSITAKYVLDIVIGLGGFLGIQVVHEKHVFGKIECECGHVNQTAPGRCAAEDGWEVELTEWHLVGPTLMALIVCLSQRLRASRCRIQEFLSDWLGISLSVSTINQCIHEAGRAVAPLEKQMIEEIQEAYQAYGDETSWKEQGVLLWLWVITTPTVCLYLVGSRGKEILQKVFGDDLTKFTGWLMSDGYSVYRKYCKRLRCWAHLLRKANGLVESHDKNEAKLFGTEAVLLFKELMDAIYEARRGDFENLYILFETRLEEFKNLCEHYRDAEHKKTRQLARELLNDWDTIWVILKYPWLPLTNNEAERALRHWVIARRISYGTRTAEGTRAFSLLASVIETCRKRKVSPWPYLSSVIAQRRKNNPAPALPLPAFQ